MLDRGQRSPLPCLPHCHVDLALVISQVNIDPDDQCLPDTDLELTRRRSTSPSASIKSYLIMTYHDVISPLLHAWV